MTLAERASGRFEVISRIAAGGMGEVYRARMSSGGGATKQVALKVVLDALSDDPHYAEMLVAEARVAMSLSHANVVQAFDAGRLGQRFFLAMEFVDGATVREILRRGGALPPAQAVTVAVEALKGLDYAHRFRDPDTDRRLDIVHRDVSPSNLLVSREGEVKVADFGIAQSTHAEEEEGTVKGKVAYMAPEQIRAEPLDRRTDIYAMGVVLYEMLTAARPFGRTTSPEMIYAVETGTFEPPRAHVPDLDPSLERITLKAMSHRAEDRYQSAAALRQELERWALESGVLLSTSDLADLVLDLPEQSGVRPQSVAIPAPTLQEGTVLTRSRVDADGVSVLLPSLDLGAQLNAAIEVGAPLTAITAEGPAPPAPRSGAPAPRPARGRRLWFGAAVAALVGASLGGVYAVSQAGPDPTEAADVTEAPPPDQTPSPVPAAAPEVPSGVDVPEGAEAIPNEAAALAPAPVEESASPRRRGRRASSEPAPALPTGTARVWIASDPWATVTMDGRPLGRTTLNGREVPAGRHAFVLRNDAAGLTHSFTATLAPGEERRFSIDLRDP